MAIRKLVSGTHLIVLVHCGMQSRVQHILRIVWHSTPNLWQAIELAFRWQARSAWRVTTTDIHIRVHSTQQ